MIGEMLETGQATLKNASKQTAKDFASSAKSQITGTNAGAQSSNSNSQSDQGTNEAGNSAQQQQKTDDQAKQFLKDLYGPTKPKGKGDAKDPANNKVNNSGQSANPVVNALGLPDIHAQAKTPEELAKIEALRKKLHSDYYQNLINAAKSKDEPVAEKLEREEQQEKFEEIQKQKEKPAFINPTIKQGTAESVVGVSG